MPAFSISSEQLRSFIERLERLESDKSELMETIRDVYAEAKAYGFDPKIMRQILRMRKMKSHDLAEQEALLDTYRQALGMLPSSSPQDDIAAV